MEYYSAIKNETLFFVATRMKLEDIIFDIILSEISHALKDCKFTFTCEKLIL